MKNLAVLSLFVLSLASCGVDGAPSKPELHGTTKFGVGSGGVVADTDLSVTFHLG